MSVCAHMHMCGQLRRVSVLTRLRVPVTGGLRTGTCMSTAPLGEHGEWQGLCVQAYACQCHRKALYMSGHLTSLSHPPARCLAGIACPLPAQRLQPAEARLSCPRCCPPLPAGSLSCRRAPDGRTALAKSLQAGLGLLGIGKARDIGLGMPAPVAGLRRCSQYVGLCTPSWASHLSAKGEGLEILD